jgi:hypothetical protein
MPRLSIHLASLGYGGLVQARFMRSVLALRRACEARGAALRLDLSGGEALVSRGRAGHMARFLAGEATHLVFADAEAAFAAEEVLGLAASAAAVATIGAAPGGAASDLRPAVLLIRREAAERMVEAYPELRAGLADIRGGETPAPLLFESLVEPGTGRYLEDVAAFIARWERLEQGAAARHPAPGS